MSDQQKRIYAAAVDEASYKLVMAIDKTSQHERWTSGWLRGDFLAEAEVLLDRGDALQGVVDLFREAGVARAQFVQPFNSAVDDGDFRRDVAEPVVGGSELLIDMLELVAHFGLEVVYFLIGGSRVVFGRHVLDDVVEHFAELFGRRLLSGHMAAVYHVGRSTHGGGWYAAAGFTKIGN